MKRFEPHPYQADAIQFMLSAPESGLLLDPGYGKTAITLAALLVLKSKGLKHRALVLAPARVVQSVWPVEREKWLEFTRGLSMVTLHGPGKERRLSDCLANPPDIIVASYDGLDWLTKHNVVDATDRHVLVCDESTWIKDGSTKRFKLLRKLLTKFGRRHILTGTPVPQGYEDLWSQMFTLDMGETLGKYVTHYRNRYFQDVGYGYSDFQLAPGCADLINERIKPLVFRGDAPEVRAQLPDVSYSRRVVTLPPGVKKLYDRLAREFEAEMDGATFLSPTAAALSQKLRQVANGIAISDDEENRQTVSLHIEKVMAVSEIVNELNGNPLLIFYEFIRDRDRLCRMFDAPYIGGGVSPAEAAKIVKEFNEGKHPVLLVHPGSAGFGLNLQEACHNVCWIGPTWNAGFWIQGNARVYRQGQTRPVVIHSVVAAGTKDEQVAEVLERKLATQDALLSAVKGE